MSVFAEVKEMFRKGRTVVDASSPLFQKLRNTMALSAPAVQSFRIQPNARDQRSVIVKACYEQGGERTLSLRPKRKVSVKALRRKAMRDAIVPQLQRFMDKSEKWCSVCSSEQDLTADHLEPFSDMADVFEQIWLDRGHRLPTVFYKDNQNHHVVCSGDSQHFIEEWKAFHNVNARYQVLCRPCNSSLGRKQ